MFVMNQYKRFLKYLFLAFKNYLTSQRLIQKDIFFDKIIEKLGKFRKVMDKTLITITKSKK